MRKVKGNTLCVIQTGTSSTFNEFGERDTVWENAIEFNGVLGLQSGGSNYTTFNAKIEESTHMIVCDFDPDIYALADTNTRIIAKSKMYDVLLIDNPDELNEHLEIYLKLTGGQNG